MAVDSDRVTVTDTATKISAVDGSPVAGHSLTVINRHATDSIDLGGSGVVSGAGFELKASENVTVDLSEGEELFGIAAAAGSVEVHVLYVGV